MTMWSVAKQVWIVKRHRGKQWNSILNYGGEPIARIHLVLILWKDFKKSRRIQSRTNEQKMENMPGSERLLVLNLNSLMKKRLKDNLLVYKCLLSKGMKIDNWWLFNLADKGLTRFNSLKFKLDKLRFRIWSTSFFFIFFFLYREDNQLKVATDALSLKAYKPKLCQ